MFIVPKTDIRLGASALLALRPGTVLALCNALDTAATATYAAECAEVLARSHVREVPGDAWAAAWMAPLAEAARAAGPAHRRRIIELLLPRLLSLHADAYAWLLDGLVDGCVDVDADGDGVLCVAVAAMKTARILGCADPPRHAARLAAWVTVRLSCYGYVYLDCPSPLPLYLSLSLCPSP